jgi:hypothetical protein
MARRTALAALLLAGQVRSRHGGCGHAGVGHARVSQIAQISIAKAIILECPLFQITLGGSVDGVLDHVIHMILFIAVIARQHHHILYLPAGGIDG